MANQGRQIITYSLIGDGKVIDESKVKSIKNNHDVMEVWVNNKTDKGVLLDISSKSTSDLTQLKLDITDLGDYVNETLPETMINETGGGVTQEQATKFATGVMTKTKWAKSGLTLSEVHDIGRKKLHLAKMVFGFEKSADKKEIEVCTCWYSQLKILNTPGYKWAEDNITARKEQLNDWMSWKLLQRIAKEDKSVKQALEACSQEDDYKY